MLNQKIAHTLTLCTTLLLIKPMMMMMMMVMIMIMIMVMIPTLCCQTFSLIKSMMMKPKFSRLENSRIGGQIVGNNKGGDFIMDELFPISIGI